MKEEAAHIEELEMLEHRELSGLLPPPIGKAKW
jgi:hypothetical protein